MIGKTISHYKILEKLGEGGMGVVYKAEDTKLKREVAIKVLPRQITSSDEERERFKLEAQAAAALNHNNIATVYEIHELEGEEFIVMEFIKGESLREKIAKGPLKLDEARGCPDKLKQKSVWHVPSGRAHPDVTNRLKSN